METSNPRLIHLVAARYRQMQGLATVSDAAFPVLLGTGLLFIRSDTAMFWYGAGVLVWFVISITWLRRRIQAYYDTRFGRTTGWAYPTSVVLFQGLTAGGVLTDMHVPAVVRVILVFLLLGGWPAWIAARDWPYRVYWAIPTVVAAAVAVPLSSRSADGGESALAVLWIVVGMSFTIAGLLDHLLLARTLRPASASEASEQATETE